MTGGQVVQRPVVLDDLQGLHQRGIVGGFYNVTGNAEIETVEIGRAHV
jgi:hypothetical protein